MVLDISVEFLAYLGIRVLKKNKNRERDPISNDIIDADQERDLDGSDAREGVPVCAGCSRTVKAGVIHELGKAWCRECYKSHVLKVHE